MEKIGVAWIRESKRNGTKYISGTLVVNNSEYKVAIFKNMSKVSDKSPDYIIYSLDNTEQPKQEENKTVNKNKEDDFLQQFSAEDNNLPF